jgi:AraC-like DNA-binding protein
MTYRKLALDSFPFLKKYVSFVYEITTEAAFDYVTIPNEHIGFTLTLNAQAYLYEQGRFVKIPPATVYGLVKKPQLIRLAEGFRELTIGFKPHFFHLFVNESMSQLGGGRPIALADVFAPNAVTAFVEQMNRPQSDDERLRCLNQFLQKQLRSGEISRLTEVAFAKIHHQHISSVSTLSDELRVSPTSLRNLFRDTVGMAPKDLIRTHRINKILKQSDVSEQNLTDIAYEAGYFDQAHFIHDFKQILGITPKHYFRNKNLIVDFYNFDRWTGNNFDVKLIQ